MLKVDIDKKRLENRGSETAKAGFRNEEDVVSRFNLWQKDKFAMKWLKAFDYETSQIKYVKAAKVPGHYKADVQVRITVVSESELQESSVNLQIKLVSNPQGFNQIDKRKVDKYVELWNIPKDISFFLKTFTGEIKPSKKELVDPRRILLTELDNEDQKKVIDFFARNKTQIVSDLLKGRGDFSADYILVILKVNGSVSWVIKSINDAISIFGNGETRITTRGSLKIGNIGMQRKGGDSGRETSKMLQFKVNPVLLFNK